MTRNQDNIKTGKFIGILVHSRKLMQDLFTAEGVEVTAGQVIAGHIRFKIKKHSF